MDPRSLRLACGISQEKAAVYSGVSTPTLRLYEANPASVTSAKKATLDAYYQGLADQQAAASKPARKTA